MARGGRAELRRRAAPNLPQRAGRNGANDAAVAVVGPVRHIGGGDVVPGGIGLAVVLPLAQEVLRPVPLGLPGTRRGTSVLTPRRRAARTAPPSTLLPAGFADHGASSEKTSSIAFGGVWGVQGAGWWQWWLRPAKRGRAIRAWVVVGMRMTVTVWQAGPLVTTGSMSCRPADGSWYT